MNRINIIRLNGIMLISLDNKQPKDLLFNRDAELIKGRVVGTSRTLNTKDVNEFLNYVEDNLLFMSDWNNTLANLALFLSELFKECNENGIDFDVPEQLVHLFNGWIL